MVRLILNATQKGVNSYLWVSTNDVWYDLFASPLDWTGSNPLDDEISWHIEDS